MPRASTMMRSPTRMSFMSSVVLIVACHKCDKSVRPHDAHAFPCKMSRCKRLRQGKGAPPEPCQRQDNEATECLVRPTCRRRHTKSPHCR
ncbi:hypothetical protein C8F01DRAFT_1121894 [Mycena amicta]|nr:hypothetical protein C8F01DRAFT_1121894 [Mycena amicta]